MCQCVDGQGLGEAGDALEQYVAVAEQGYQQGVDEVLLADDALLHALADESEHTALCRYLVIDLADVEIGVHVYVLAAQS